MNSCSSGSPPRLERHYSDPQSEVESQQRNINNLNLTSCISHGLCGTLRERAFENYCSGNAAFILAAAASRDFLSIAWFWALPPHHCPALTSRTSLLFVEMKKIVYHFNRSFCLPVAYDTAYPNLRGRYHLYVDPSSPER